MKEISCPFCDRPLTAGALAHGCCDFCGRKIPPFVQSEAASTGNHLEVPTPTTDSPTEIPASVGPSGSNAVPDSSSPYQPTQGWFFIPLPPERLTSAWATAVVSIPLFLVVGLLGVWMPLHIIFIKPMNMVGLLCCLGPGLGAFMATLAHLVALFRGFRLSAPGVAIIVVSYFLLLILANSASTVWEMHSLKQRFLEAHDGEPEFAVDSKLKAGFLAVLNQLSRTWENSTKLYVRCIEKHDTQTTPEAQAALEVWKRDPAFAEDVRLDREIPGSTPHFSTVGPYHIAERLRFPLETIVPKDLLKIDWLSADDSTKNKLVLDLAATTRREDTFTKFSSGFVRPCLMANIRIEWQVRLLNRDGAVLYSGAWTSRPAARITFCNEKSAIEQPPYNLLQRSGHDNFARELLGRMGLPPGPVITVWWDESTPVILPW